MALESATYINDLIVTNPVGASDRLVFLDDHIRLLKNTLKATFPNVTGAVTSTHTELNIVDGVTATAAELNILNGVTATAAELNYLSGVTSNVQDQIDAKRDSFSAKAGQLGGQTFAMWITTSLTDDAEHGRWTIGRGRTGMTLSVQSTTTPNTKLRVTSAGVVSLTIRPQGPAGTTFKINGTSVEEFLIGDGVTVEMVYIDSTTGWSCFVSQAYNA